MYREAMGANGWAHGGTGRVGGGFPVGSTGSLRNWQLSVQNTPYPPPAAKYFELRLREVAIRWSTVWGTCDALIVGLGSLLARAVGHARYQKREFSPIFMQKSQD